MIKMAYDHVHRPNQETPLYAEHTFHFKGQEVLIAEDLGIASGHGRPTNEYEKLFPHTERVLHVIGYITERNYRQDGKGHQVSRIEKFPVLDWDDLSKAIKESDLEGCIDFTS